MLRSSQKNAPDRSGFVIITAKHTITSPINILVKGALIHKRHGLECVRQNYRQLIPLCIDCHGKHNEVASRGWRRGGVPFSGVSGQENAGVILNHTLIQQKMTAIVDALRIEFNP